MVQPLFKRVEYARSAVRRKKQRAVRAAMGQPFVNILHADKARRIPLCGERHIEKRVEIIAPQPHEADCGGESRGENGIFFKHSVISPQRHKGAKKHGKTILKKNSSR